MISLDRCMATGAEQLKTLQIQQRMFAKIKRAFGDAHLGTLEDNSRGYISDRVDGSTKGAKPIVLTSGQGRFCLRYVITVGEECVYSQISKTLSSSEVASLINGLLKTQSGKDAVSVLMLGSHLQRMGSEH